jgi:hypothetical protein
MSHNDEIKIKIKEGQSFQDRTGLTVRAGEVDANHRVHFSVTAHQGSAYAEPGEMSYFAFVSRFTRIN